MFNNLVFAPRFLAKNHLLRVSIACAGLATGSLLSAMPPVAGTTADSAGVSRQPSSHHPVTKPHKPIDVKVAKPDPSARYLDIAGFGSVAVYTPKDPVRGIALFASGDGGWNLGVREMAATAASLGYWVAGFDTPALLKTMAANDSACIDMAGAMANLGKQVKVAMKLPADWRPLLIGYSSGATINYAALVQAGDPRFSGAMSLGFCPDLLVHKPFCAGAGLSAHKPGGKKPGIIFDVAPEVPAPWIVLQGDIDQVCSPPETIEFVQKVKNASVVELPHVGHGYGVPKNWMPQYRRGLIKLRDADPSTPATAADSTPP